MDPATIAARRARAQRLWSTTFADPAEALVHLLAVQAQEHPFARWSLAQRTRRPDPAAVDRAFDDGRILRTHVLRPTWHYVAPGDLRWLIALSGPRVAANNARRYAELDLTPKVLARTDALIADAVAREPLTRGQIGDLLARKRIAPDGQRLPHILMHAELSATICSGPMHGKQHTYASFDDRVSVAKPLDREQALEQLARRYFTTRGPATLKDFAWWSGLPATDARRALTLASPSLEQTVVASRTYWFAPGSQPRKGSKPRADFVQCYDEAIISYTESRDVLKSSRASFAVPGWSEGYAHVVLLDGRLLGHWRARNGTVETRIDARLTPAERKAVVDATRRCARFFGMR